MKTNTDKIIDKLLNDGNFLPTTILIIKMMHDYKELNEYLGFYVRILEAIKNNEKVDEIEKEHFLAIHFSSIKAYNSVLGVKSI